MKDYRKIWEKINGPIPLDECGRRYEIHHIDGNRNNNDLSNLQCVSIEEHFKIHYDQGDWAAAFRIAQRMTIDPEIKSKLMSKSNKKRLEEGSHPFLQEEFKKLQQRAMTSMINDNKHPFQNPEVIKKAIKVKQEKYNHEELSEQTRKGWENWKKNNPGADRTTKGSKVGADKIRGTRWYHKLDGSQLRTTPDNPRIVEEGWLQGRFRGKELSVRANFCNLNKNNK